MRVIIIADYAIAEGGAPQVAIASALGLAARGHDVTYLQGVGQAGDTALDAEPRIRRIALNGQDVWHKPSLAAARDGIWNRDHAAKLGAILAGFDPAESVVHVHQWTKFFSPSIFAAIASAGLPLVVSLHDYFISCPTGLMYRFDRREPCQLRPLSAPCLVAPCDPRSRLHKVIRVLRTVATRHTLGALPFTAIHVSETGRRTIGHLLPASTRQVVLENPIECIDAGIRSPGAALKLTYCGRLTEEKGADLVAMAARAAGLPSLFIGDGPLRQRILNLDPAAEITGWLDKGSVRQRIARDALAVVAPSRWPETGPLVVAEAMAAGVPVIVSDRAGAAGRVRDGETGFVVPPEAAAIARAATALTDPETGSRIGSAAYRDFWAAPPSLAAHAAQLEAIYHAARQAQAPGNGAEGAAS